MDPGPERDFDELYRSHRRGVRRRAAALVAPDEVDDVVAIAFATAWRRRAELPATEAEVARWLRSTTELAARNVRRSRRRRAAIGDRLLEQPEPPPEAGPEESTARLAPEVLRALRRLHPEDRYLIVATVFEGRPTVDVADALGLTSAAARTRLSRARARLRSLLGHRR